MADFKLQLQRELVDAAARRPARTHHRTSPAIVPAVTLACIAALALALHPWSSDPGSKPATRSAFAEQLALLGVLRDKHPADNDRQVLAETRNYTRAQMPVRPGYARLLGKAPSGYAFILLPVTHFTKLAPGKDGTFSPKTIRDGICLMRRGSEGGAGMCVTTRQLQAGELNGALAGQAYGVVPDGIVAVRPHGRTTTVPVNRNFYVFPAPAGNDFRVTWLDAQGNPVTPHRP
jgi:hypothetical protein